MVWCVTKTKNMRRVFSKRHVSLGNNVNYFLNCLRLQVLGFLMANKDEDKKNLKKITKTTFSAKLKDNPHH